MQSLKDKIIEILLRSKRLDKEKLDSLIQLQKKKKTPLRQLLIEEKLIKEEELLSLLSEELYMPMLHLNRYRFDPEVVRVVSEQTARLYKLIPVSRMGDTLTVAMSDPLNVFALDDLKVLTGCKIDTVLSSEDEILKAIEQQYHLESGDMREILEESTALETKGVEVIKEQEIELASIIKDSQKAPIVRLVELMLSQALKKRASDIHLEPEYDSMRVRYRIDGALHDEFKVPAINQNAVLARLKIISGLDITESRIPQDGRFKVRFENREVDFRVSSLPTVFGQKFVLRALDKSNLSVGLDALGFAEEPLRVFKEAIARPFGMILVTGPTGSGKSTTLYSVLNQLNRPDLNIITIEDPVEYQVEGITQIQVKYDIGMDFSSGLRSLLRQSPDVIMIGEIRDTETADIAIKASLTGQMVFSTLHTNDAISSITRLIDMNVEPFLVASSLVMLCAQRLLRKICLKCRMPVKLKDDFLERMGFKKFMPAQFYESAGCKYCNNTGFYGRIAVLETVLIDDAIRDMIIKRKSIEEIQKYAVEKLNFRTLRDDAFLKVKQGLTTLDEALRVTAEES